MRLRGYCLTGLRSEPRSWHSGVVREGVEGAELKISEFSVDFCGIFSSMPDSSPASSGLQIHISLSDSSQAHLINTSSRESCLLVLNAVTSTPQWIRQPEPRDMHDVHITKKYYFLRKKIILYFSRSFVFS